MQSLRCILVRRLHCMDDLVLSCIDASWNWLWIHEQQRSASLCERCCLRIHRHKPRKPVVVLFYMERNLMLFRNMLKYLSSGCCTLGQSCLGWVNRNCCNVIFLQHSMVSLTPSNKYGMPDYISCDMDQSWALVVTAVHCWRYGVDRWTVCYIEQCSFQQLCRVIYTTRREYTGCVDFLHCLNC